MLFSFSSIPNRTRGNRLPSSIATESPTIPAPITTTSYCPSRITIELSRVSSARSRHAVFVRKRLVEIQYLKTPITDHQRQEFSHIVHDTIRRIKSAEFLPHSGIRFPQN